MKIFRWVWLALTLGLLGYAFYQGMYVAPTEATMGDIQRIFYYHFPSAMMAFLFFFVSFVASIVYLASAVIIPSGRSPPMLPPWPAEMGIVFCTLVLIQGPLWARPVWGIWWTWDARLTTTLVLWLIYASYLLLRKFADGPQMQTLAAVLAIFGYVDVPIVYYSTRWWRTQHPSPVISGDGTRSIPRCGLRCCGTWLLGLPGGFCWPVGDTTLNGAAKSRNSTLPCTLSKPAWK